MKTILYVATVTRAYRKAIDDYFTDPGIYRKNLPWYLGEIGKCTNREFTTGFYFGRPGAEAQIYEGKAYRTDAVFIGNVTAVEEGNAVFLQRNKFAVSDRLEILKPDGANIETTVRAIYDGDGHAMKDAPHASMRLHVTLDPTPEPGDVLRIVRQKEEN